MYTVFIGFVCVSVVVRLAVCLCRGMVRVMCECEYVGVMYLMRSSKHISHRDGDQRVCVCVCVFVCLRVYMLVRVCTQSGACVDMFGAQHAHLFLRGFGKQPTLSAFGWVRYGEFGL